jgi:hypothetical protein
MLHPGGGGSDEAIMAESIVHDCRDGAMSQCAKNTSEKEGEFPVRFSPWHVRR